MKRKSPAASEPVASGTGATPGQANPAAENPLPGPLIPEAWRKDVEDLLTAGLAVEDIVEAVIAKGGPEIPEGAILAHFRTRPELQARRVKQTVAGTAEMREALGNPQADHTLVELANSALMIGYMGLTKKRGASITIKDAEVVRLARQNLKLRRRVLRMKELNEKRAHEVHWRRIRYEDVKYQTAVERLKQLRRGLRTLMEEGKLDAGTLERIREIYGIIRQPYTLENTEEAPAQG